LHEEPNETQVISETIHERLTLTASAIASFSFSVMKYQVRRLVGSNEPVFAHLRKPPLKVFLAVDHHAQIDPDEGN
jgi:hypothetical protein